MNTYYLTALDEQFKCDCKVINLSYEYPGYTGDEKWAIITDLTEKELIEKYDEIISSYRPFILLSSLFGSVRADYPKERNGVVFRHNQRDIGGKELWQKKGEIIKAGFCEQANRSVLTVSMNISMRTVTVSVIPYIVGNS